jgi:hypothetical protein
LGMNIRTIIWGQRPLSITYDIISLTNSTPLTADTSLLCTKTCTQVMVLIPLSIEKCVFSCLCDATALPSDLLHSN